MDITIKAIEPLLKVAIPAAAEWSDTALIFGLYVDIEPGSIKNPKNATDDKVGAAVVFTNLEVFGGAITYDTLMARITNAKHAIVNYLAEHEWTGPEEKKNETSQI